MMPSAPSPKAFPVKLRWDFPAIPAGAAKRLVHQRRSPARPPKPRRLLHGRFRGRNPVAAIARTRLAGAAQRNLLPKMRNPSKLRDVLRVDSLGIPIRRCRGDDPAGPEQRTSSLKYLSMLILLYTPLCCKRGLRDRLTGGAVVAFG